MAMLNINVTHDIRRTLAPHRIGNDPTTLLAPGELWRSTLTPDGPATLHLRWDDAGVEGEVWGPGGGWMLERLPDLIGLGDTPHVFPALAHPAVLAAQRNHPALRLSNGHCLYHSILPVVIGQRVTTVEAQRSWRRLCLQFGEMAPGPVKLRLPPSPKVLAALPYWSLHPLGIDQRRADALRRVAENAEHLYALDDESPCVAAQRVGVIPGIGPWTIGASFGHALGDTDAVAVGDYHLKNSVSYALAGEPRGTDERMLELLEPYRGQRARVIALLVANGPYAPRYGPRRRILPMERW